MSRVIHVGWAIIHFDWHWTIAGHECQSKRQEGGKPTLPEQTQGVTTNMTVKTRDSMEAVSQTRGPTNHGRPPDMGGSARNRLRAARHFDISLHQDVRLPCFMYADVQ